MVEPMDTIEELFPMNIVLKIVENFIGKKRKSLMFVSKAFYQAVCLVEEPRCVMRINDRFLNDNSIMESILNSTQRIQNACYLTDNCNDANICNLIHVLKSHGKSIKHLTISIYGIHQKIISALYFMELFRHINLKSLTLNFDDIRIINWIRTECLLGKEGSLIFKLSITNNCDIGDNFIHIFQPHSVKEIMINGKWKQFNDFMKLQTSIRTMNISHENFLEPKLFEQLKLEEFGMDFVHDQVNVEQANELLLQLIQDHSLMKRVQFYHSKYLFPDKRLCSGFEMAPFLLSVMRQMPNLEMIQLSVNQRIIPHINQLYHLSKSTLLFLDITDTSENDLIVLSKTPLPNLEKLRIIKKCKQYGHDDDQENQNKTKVFMENIGRSWSNIKEFSFDGCLPSFNTVLENMYNIEKIEVSSYHSGVSFYHNSKIYPKMKSFKSLFFESNTSLSNILDSMPYLKELRIRDKSQIEYTPYLLYQLTKMKNLEVLYAGFKIMSSIAVAGEKEVMEFKQLFSKLKECSVSFLMEEWPLCSFKQLYNDLKDCLNLNVFIASAQERLVIQKNVKDSCLAEDNVDDEN